MRGIFVLQCCEEGAGPAPSSDTFVMKGFGSQTNCEFYWGLKLHHSYGENKDPFHVMSLKDYLDTYGRQSRLSDHRGYAHIVTRRDDGKLYTGGNINPITANLINKSITLIDVIDPGVDNCAYPTSRLSSIRPIDMEVANKLLLGRSNFGEYTHIAATDFSTGQLVETSKANLQAMIAMMEQKHKDVCFLVVYHDCRISVIRETENLMWGHAHIPISTVSGEDLQQITVENSSITFDAIGFDEYEINMEDDNDGN